MGRTIVNYLIGFGEESPFINFSNNAKSYFSFLDFLQHSMNQNLHPNFLVQWIHLEHFFVFAVVRKTNSKQECIPIGCVRSAAVAICLGGVCSGGRLPRRWGVSAWGRGCLPRGSCIPECTVDRMTDRFKNITLPQLRCGR